MKKTELPTFKWSFLYPKYWVLILGLILFKLILCLPYSWLLKLANIFTYLYTKTSIGKKRIFIAKRNLELCFPEMEEQARNKLLNQNTYETAMGIIETGMAWFWSDRRIRKWSSVIGLENIKNNAKDGIILVGIHFLTLELGARIIGLHHPGVGVYRPNNNPLLDWVQTKGRLKSNKDMLDRNDLRGMLRAIKNKHQMIWFAPDHDYGIKSSVFVPFFAVKQAATTTGSYFLIKHSPESKVIPFTPRRNLDGSGYQLLISEPVDFSACNDAIETASLMNKVIEKEILKAPEQYMWLHRRFKTRPNNYDKSLYL